MKNWERNCFKNHCSLLIQHWSHPRVRHTLGGNPSHTASYLHTLGSNTHTDKHTYAHRHTHTCFASKSNCVLNKRSATHRRSKARQIREGSLHKSQCAQTLTQKHTHMFIEGTRALRSVRSSSRQRKWRYSTIHRHRQTHTDRHTHIHRHTHTHSRRRRHTEMHRDTHTHIHRQTHTNRESERETQKESQRCIETHADRYRHTKTHLLKIVSVQNY